MKDLDTLKTVTMAAVLSRTGQIAPIWMDDSMGDQKAITTLTTTQDLAMDIILIELDILEQLTNRTTTAMGSTLLLGTRLATKQ